MRTPKQTSRGTGIRARPTRQYLNTGYGNHGASSARKSMAGWIWAGGDPRADIDANLATLRQRSRDLYMGAPLAAGALKTARTNVVGAGLKLKATPDAELLGLSPEQARAWARRTEREFALWAESNECDLQRQNTFGELQSLAFLSWLMSGDVFALLPYKPRAAVPYDLRIDLLEADRVCNPGSNVYTWSSQQTIKLANGNQVTQGVEYSADGELVAFHVSNNHPLSVETDPSAQWARVEVYGANTGRRNVLHLYEQERPGQRRGVPILAPVIVAIKQLDRYADAELMAAVVGALFTVFVENDSPDSPLGELLPTSDQITTGGTDANDIQLAPGAVVGLRPGEKISVVNPGRPNANFPDFVTAVARQIGAALEIPYELLFKSFTASYSASRAALLEAWKMFRMRRTWLAHDFCQPAYTEWLWEAVAKGRVIAPGFGGDPLITRAWAGAEWNGPAPGQLDPMKEAQAAKLRIDEELSTRAKEAAEINGSDFEGNHAQRVTEEALRKADGTVPPTTTGTTAQRSANE